MTTALRCRATGVSFVPGYPGTLADLKRRCDVAGPIGADLVRDHDNAEDLNATAIVVEGRRLGWVPRDFAAFIAPQIDDGAAWAASVIFVAIDREHPRRPGLEVELYRKDES